MQSAINNRRFNRTNVSERSRSGAPVKKLSPLRLAKCRSSDDDKPQVPQQSALEKTIRRKQQEIEGVLTEMGMEAVDERLQNSVQSPAVPPYRLSQLIEQMAVQGKAVLVYEVARTEKLNSSTELAKFAKLLVDLGVDAVAVKTDSGDTPEGLRDLWSVAQAVRVPVIGRDWLIHPYQVNGKGTSIMSSFSAAIGLDAPVEVVNLREVEILAQSGVVFYAINVSVGLSLSLPGFAQDMAHGILGELPFGAISIVGCKTIEEASKARQSGADALLIKHELVQESADNPRDMLSQLQFLTCGDD
eukprot:gene12667-15899_t